MARYKAMMSRGGENPYDVSYSEKQEKGMNDIENEAALKESESTGGILDKGAKAFSFWAEKLPERQWNAVKVSTNWIT